MVLSRAEAPDTSITYCESQIPNIVLQQESAGVVETTVLRPCDKLAKEELNREAERQAIFQKVSNEILKIPNGYLKVEVLIIRWNEDLDDFKEHSQEVTTCLMKPSPAIVDRILQIKKLEDILETGFGFHCTTERLDMRRDPQVLLNSAITNHIIRHDGEHNLLIVYYTGHGKKLESQDGGGLQIVA